MTRITAAWSKNNGYLDKVSVMLKPFVTVSLSIRWGRPASRTTSSSPPPAIIRVAKNFEYLAAPTIKLAPAEWTPTGSPNSGRIQFCSQVRRRRPRGTTQLSDIHTICSCFWSATSSVHSHPNNPHRSEKVFFGGRRRRQEQRNIADNCC